MQDLVQRLRDHSALVRRMDAIVNAEQSVQTNEPTAKLLDKAARVIELYRARYPEQRTAELAEYAANADNEKADAAFRQACADVNESYTVWSDACERLQRIGKERLEAWGELVETLAIPESQ